MYIFGVNDTTHVMEHCDLIISAPKAEAKRIVMEIANSVALNVENSRIVFCLSSFAVDELSEFLDKHSIRPVTIEVAAGGIEHAFDEYAELLGSRLHECTKHNIASFAEYKIRAAEPNAKECFFFFEDASLEHEKVAQLYRKLGEVHGLLGVHCIMLSDEQDTIDAFPNAIVVSDEDTVVSSTVVITTVIPRRDTVVIP